MVTLILFVHQSMYQTPRLKLYSTIYFQGEFVLSSKTISLLIETLLIHLVDLSLISSQLEAIADSVFT